MKKRVLSLLLCTAMVMSLAVGCGSSDKKEAETKEDTSKRRVRNSRGCGPENCLCHSRVGEKCNRR